VRGVHEERKEVEFFQHAVSLDSLRAASDVAALQRAFLVLKLKPGGRGWGWGAKGDRGGLRETSYDRLGAVIFFQFLCLSVSLSLYFRNSLTLCL